MSIVEQAPERRVGGQEAPRNGERTLANLVSLYGPERGLQTFGRLREIVGKAKERFREERLFPHTGKPTQKDIALITSPNAFLSQGRRPLENLDSFLSDDIGDAMNTVHILPFHPFTSDRGFSVADYDMVEPTFGTWDDISAIGGKKRLMTDLVLGHVSAQHKWVQDRQYGGYVIEVDPDAISAEDKAKVVRPRTTPFYTDVTTDDGRTRTLWTTFSVNDTTDQIDLNYKNPDVLLDMIATNLDHMSRGAAITRLDAIAYLWKDLGTGCINRPEVHTIVQILNDVRSEVFPASTVITETNVPHDENISYFNEADWVYNFSLSPLLLHAYETQDASYLRNWAATRMHTPSENNAFFNFLGSHDGIGVRGAVGILPDAEINRIANRVERHGGKVSYRSLPDGGQAPYELNATWWSALNSGEEERDLEIRKFVTSHAISFALQGVPAVYYHSMLGSENDIETWQRTQTNRDINEKKLDYDDVKVKLGNPDTKEAKVFGELKRLMEYRGSRAAFSPSAPQEIIEGIDNRIFGIRRMSDEGDIIALHNLSSDTVRVTYGNATYFIKPYDFLWETAEPTSLANAA